MNYSIYKMIKWNELIHSYATLPIETLSFWNWGHPVDFYNMYAHI